MNLTPQQVARKIAAAASDKKARDILLLNMENLSPLTDYFIIASADNVRLRGAYLFRRRPRFL